MNPVFTAAHVSKLSPLFHRIATEVSSKQISTLCIHIQIAHSSGIGLKLRSERPPEALSIFWTV